MNLTFCGQNRVFKEEATHYLTTRNSRELYTFFSRP